MPLYRSPAADAIMVRKANEYSFWGTRESRNRIEPIADPHFDFDLKLEPGEAIFTIGSCFARNVESRLALAGYRLPMRDLMEHKSFAGVHPRALNNFSTPSIWNELSWAVGHSAFDEQLAVVEYTPGKWLDLHVTANVRPMPRETVLRQRAAISDAYRKFTECRLVIMTLGLVEVWYDLEAESYLNSIPPPPLIRRCPDRFELHVLDHRETLDYCERSIELIRKHGREDVTILVSVSPVALGVTHRPEDVITANCYSKAVLRAVTEEIVARYDNVHYFPSYESVTLSDRRLAWANDFTHVTDTLVAHNVDRLLRRLTRADEAAEEIAAKRAEIEAGGASAAYRLALDARRGDPVEAERFFAAFGDWSDRSALFAVEHAEWLVGQRRPEQALEVAAKVDGDNERAALASARALILQKRPADALAILDRPLFHGSRSMKYWSQRVEAQGKLGDLAGLERSLVGWCAALPKKTGQIRVQVARALLTQSSVARALELLQLALTDEPDSPLAQILTAEAYLARGDEAEARLAFERAEPRTPSETRRYQKLKTRIAQLEPA